MVYHGNHFVKCCLLKQLAKIPCRSGKGYSEVKIRRRRLHQQPQSKLFSFSTAHSLFHLIIYGPFGIILNHTLYYTPTAVVSLSSAAYISWETGVQSLVGPLLMVLK